MIAAALGFGLMGALVLVYMTPPMLRDRRISAAEFLSDLPPPKRRQRRFVLSAPLMSRSFYVRLLILALLVLALWQHLQRLADAAGDTLGVAFLIDVSDSMRTRANASSYLDLAKQYAHEVLDYLEERSRDVKVCTSLSTFDVQHSLIARHSLIAQTRSSLDALVAIPSGTDLGLLAQILAEMVRPTDKVGAGDTPVDHCRPDYLVVISDQPARALDSPEGVDVIWRDVSQNAANAAIMQVRQVRQPLTDATRYVDVEVAKWGVGQTDLIIQGPRERTRHAIQWSGAAGTLRFLPEEKGEYRFTLEKGGAYDGDDHVRTFVRKAQSLGVDWRIAANPALFRLLNWRVDPASTTLRVVAAASSTDPDKKVPTIFVGPGFSEGRSEIGEFIEAHPVLHGVNFDFVETLGVPALDSRRPGDSQPLLAGADGSAWVRATQAAVWLPAAPEVSDSDQARLTLTLFLNSVRWLTERGDAIGPAYFRADGTRLSNVDGEGAVSPPRSFGDYRGIRAREKPAQGDVLWPYLVLMACVLFAIDRLLTFFAAARYE